MTAQASVSTGHQLAPAQVAEHQAWSTRGVKVLLAGVAAVLAGVAVVWYSTKQTGDTATALVWAAVIVLIIAAFLLAGLTPVVPGQARVIQLFGKYRGTIRDQGLQWVNPFTRRIRVSTRIRNHETAQAKVNDADGNPIEIAAVVVWQVQDTAKAIYSVDEYTKFVAIQTETAVRHVASSYPYTSHGSGELSLRDNAEEITQRLSAEIAQAMLRQQQANAIVGARQRIVEGAVDMVQLALKRLEEEGVVELDEERKAAMVSNLLVVLCSEQATQQVVNTGSLYQ
jgi:hypothetical protein